MMGVERTARGAKRTRLPAAVTALVLTLLAGGTAAAPDTLPRGQIVEKVSCADDPQQSYALYVPASYDPARHWPVVYLFDPSARGARAAERFRKGAETYGFLLAASNNSKNGPINESLGSARALWKDTHARFTIDDRRVYTAGFSGGARVAALVGQMLSGSVAGVIACGAGFPDGRPPAKDTPFAYFGTAGDTDFNLSEMKSLDATLEKLGIPHYLETFEGTHQWPTEQICAEALEWMRVREAARGIAKDPALVESSFARRLARASREEAGGRTLEAYREYASITRDFRGLRDVADVRKRLSELEKDDRVRSLFASEEKREKAERSAIDRLTAKLDTIRTAQEPPVLPRLLAELEISDWKKRAGSASRDEALAARRVLEWLFVRASLFLPQELLARRDFSRAILALSVSTEIKPQSPQAWYNRACAEARAGHRKKALEELRVAVEKGFRDRKWIESDADLEPLREDEQFRQIVESLPPAESAPER